jgi:hypothetical protein
MARPVAPNEPIVCPKALGLAGHHRTLVEGRDDARTNADEAADLFAGDSPQSASHRFHFKLLRDGMWQFLGNFMMNVKQ